MRSYLWGLLESSQVITLFGPLLGFVDCVWNLCQVLVDTVNPVCIILPPTSTSYWHNSQRSLVGSKGKQARTVLFESNMASTGTIAGTRLSSCVWVGVKGNPGSSLACLLQVVGTYHYMSFSCGLGCHWILGATRGDSPDLLKPLLESFQAARTAMQKEMEKATTSNTMTHQFLPCTVSCVSNMFQV